MIESCPNIVDDVIKKYNLGCGQFLCDNGLFVYVLGQVRISWFVHEDVQLCTEDELIQAQDLDITKSYIFCSTNCIKVLKGGNKFIISNSFIKMQGVQDGFEEIFDSSTIFDQNINDLENWVRARRSLTSNEDLKRICDIVKIDLSLFVYDGLVKCALQSDTNKILLELCKMKDLVLHGINCVNKRLTLSFKNYDIYCSDHKIDVQYISCRERVGCGFFVERGQLFVEYDNVLKKKAFKRQIENDCVMSIDSLYMLSVNNFQIMTHDQIVSLSPRLRVVDGGFCYFNGRSSVFWGKKYSKNNVVLLSKDIVLVEHMLSDRSYYIHISHDSIYIYHKSFVFKLTDENILSCSVNRLVIDKKELVSTVNSIILFKDGKLNDLEINIDQLYDLCQEKCRVVDVVIQKLSNQFPIVVENGICKYYLDDGKSISWKLSDFIWSSYQSSFIKVQHVPIQISFGTSVNRFFKVTKGVGDYKTIYTFTSSYVTEVLASLLDKSVFKNNESFDISVDQIDNWISRRNLFCNNIERIANKLNLVNRLTLQGDVYTYRINDRQSVSWYDTSIQGLGMISDEKYDLYVKNDNSYSIWKICEEDDRFVKISGLSCNENGIILYEDSLEIIKRGGRFIFKSNEDGLYLEIYANGNVYRSLQIDQDVEFYIVGDYIGDKLNSTMCQDYCCLSKASSARICKLLSKILKLSDDSFLINQTSVKYFLDDKRDSAVTFNCNNSWFVSEVNSDCVKLISHLNIVYLYKDRLSVLGDNDKWLIKSKTDGLFVEYYVNNILQYTVGNLKDLNVSEISGLINKYVIIGKVDVSGNMCRYFLSPCLIRWRNDDVVVLNFSDSFSLDQLNNKIYYLHFVKDGVDIYYNSQKLSFYLCGSVVKSMLVVNGKKRFDCIVEVGEESFLVTDFNVWCKINLQRQMKQTRQIRQLYVVLCILLLCLLLYLV